MWRRYNPNPQGLMVGDCTVRAICAVTGREWRDVHRELCDLARDMADFAASQARQDNYLQNALTAQTQYFLSLYPPHRGPRCLRG